MQPIMLARAAHLQAFTNVFQRIGAPVERELQTAGLPAVLDLQPGANIPVLPAIRFIQRSAYREDIGDVGFLASREQVFDRLSEEFILLSHSAPTLYARLRQFCELAPLENSNCRVSLLREGDDIRICNNLLGYPAMDGLQYSEWIQIMAVVEIIRKTVGPGWCPSEITFRSQFSPGESAFEHFPDARFLFGHRDTSIKAPAALLSQLLRRHQSDHGLPAASTPTHRLPAKAGLDFPGSLKAALRSYLPQGCPNIDLAAEIASTSVRTLQRSLAQFGLSYSGLVQQVRFEVAAELLEDPSLNSLDVALAVGYDDPSHFARAFRRVAGISPREYRRRQSVEI